MGTPAIAAWIAHVAFWALLIAGVALGELGKKPITTFLILWFAGLWGLPYIPYGAALFSSFVAVLDVALVLLVFKGDIRIT
jgi:hypothetical protein